MKTCYFCQFVLDEQMEVFRTSVCPSCGRDLKICKSCRFFSPGAHWDCAETIEDPVFEKEQRNFCSWFKFKDTKSINTDTKKKQGAKAEFDKLFGD